MYPDSPSYNASKLAYRSNLTPKPAWLGYIQSYSIALDSQLDLAKVQVAMIQPNYHPNAI